MRVEKKIIDIVQKAIKSLYKANIDLSRIQIQKTRKEFEGDFTVVVFPFLAYSKKNPEATGQEIGTFISEELSDIAKFNVVKGFLNLSLTDTFWVNFFSDIYSQENYGFSDVTDDSEKIVIEYSSPNTNKPLHLGHIRNNLVGWSISKILEANGKKVTRVNLVNDRGIHICKSMLAWSELADGETPEDAKMKGDHLVGKYYVLFDQEYKKQIAELVEGGMSEDEAKHNAPWMKKAHGMLKRWERGNSKIRKQWKMMNDWVYAGFDETYEKLGISFDKIYYESDTYLIGKDVVMKGLRTGEIQQKPDGTVFLDLAEYGMDEKVLLRADGTTVYMTQDIGTAVLRYEDFKFDESLYVVGNEQDYHFKVLSIILDRLEYPWANRLTHISYGMVELPDGKMKSREGTVVDADDLIESMIATAKSTSDELGKLIDFSDEEKAEIFHKIALGALKFFILKVDAKKNMTFNPKESIEFNGNTGPFVQYSYVRINSLLAKIEKDAQKNTIKRMTNLLNKEKQIIRLLYDYPEIIKDAGEKRNPSLIASFVYDLAKEYNQFYHDFPIIKETNEDIQNFRLSLSKMTGDIIKQSLDLLGIAVPERM